MGQLISQKVDEKDITQEYLGQLISSSKQNVGNIFTRPSVDSDLLKRISEALEFDFFSVYYQDGFLQATREKEVEPLTSRITMLEARVAELETKLAEKEETLADYKKMIDSNATAIMMLEEVHQYRTGKAPQPGTDDKTPGEGEKQ
ncbi:MAG: hypothetical protein ABW019_02170 [Chitinophagaceae bacterium]